MSTASRSESAADTPVMLHPRSGKGPKDENFPVGSFLLPKRIRSHVAAYYAYARAIDDIADSPHLPAGEKVRRLEDYKQTLDGTLSGRTECVEADRLRRTMDDAGVDRIHGTDLIVAFKQDAIKTRYRDWDELMHYCRYSAAPVGRFLIDLHGERQDCYPASDALCSALQVLNHLQDCKADYQLLDRVYVPMDWMDEFGAHVSDLSGDAISPAIRGVKDRCLKATDALLEAARPLPRMIHGIRFAMESQTIVHIATRLRALLARKDPLAQRVALPRWELAGCFVRAVLGRSRVLTRRPVAPNGLDSRKP